MKFYLVTIFVILSSCSSINHNVRKVSSTDSNEDVVQNIRFIENFHNPNLVRKFNCPNFGKCHYIDWSTLTVKKELGDSVYLTLKSCTIPKQYVLSSSADKTEANLTKKYLKHSMCNILLENHPISSFQIQDLDQFLRDKPFKDHLKKFSRDYKKLPSYASLIIGMSFRRGINLNREYGALAEEQKIDMHKIKGDLVGDRTNLIRVGAKKQSMLPRDIHVRSKRTNPGFENFRYTVTKLAETLNSGKDIGGFLDSMMDEIGE